MPPMRCLCGGNKGADLRLPVAGWCAAGRGPPSLDPGRASAGLAKGRAGRRGPAAAWVRCRSTDKLRSRSWGGSGGCRAAWRRCAWATTSSPRCTASARSRAWRPCATSTCPPTPSSPPPSSPESTTAPWSPAAHALRPPAAARVQMWQDVRRNGGAPPPASAPAASRPAGVRIGRQARGSLWGGGG
jgi:hypothetical protein